MELSELRENIDRIDSQIVSLINERYEYVKGVGEWKTDRSSAIYVPEREKALLQKLELLNTEGLLENKTLRAIYREIMSGALALEHPLKIGYLGPEATFTQQAALGKFGRSVNYQPCSNIAEVFTEVEMNRINYGCVPIENSTEGAVNYTLDRFIDSNVKICAEINMSIHQNLLANCKTSEIKRIYSHPQALGQCRNWLQKRYPGVDLIEVSSTTKAAKIASIEDNTAAIASSLAAETYSLQLLEDNIEDNCDNTTRFLIIGKQEPLPTGDDKI